LVHGQHTIIVKAIIVGRKDGWTMMIMRRRKEEIMVVVVVVVQTIFT